MTSSKLNWSSKLFIALLDFQAVVELVIGVTMLSNFQFAVENGFQLEYFSEMEFLGTTMGLQLLFLTSILFLAAYLTLKRNISGPILGMACGLFFTIFGIVVFIKYNNTDGIFIDSVRGAITFILGYLTFRQFKGRNDY